MATEVGAAYFDDEESTKLREYLEKGGFLWADDFWGSFAWDFWQARLDRILPPSQYHVVDLPPGHPLFHTQFEVAAVPQIPSINFWMGSGGGTSERGRDSAVPHARAVFDAAGRIMPPWAAVAGYGRFQNDPSLTQGEWDLLVAWVDGGAPSGQTLQEGEVPPLFVPSDAAWLQGEPDLTAKAPKAQEIAANAPDRVERMEFDLGLSGDQRVHGIAFKPGARRVVRYASIFEAGTNRWLFTWTPWGTAMHLPENVAFTLKAGTKLNVEIGYHGTEEAVSDTSEVGLYLEKSGAAGLASVLAMQSGAAEVPPGGKPVKFRAELQWDETAALQAVYPETTAGTTSLELTAMLPDGGVRPLLWLRDYRADWPTPYLYVDPVPLPRGAKLVMTTYVANTGEQPLKAQPRLHLTRVPASATTF